VYLAKIERRIKEYKINMLNGPRPGKKLLVLDVDYTLYDHRSSAETGYELMRPFLHEFLISAYQVCVCIAWVNPTLLHLGVWCTFLSFLTTWNKYFNTCHTDLIYILDSTNHVLTLDFEIKFYTVKSQWNISLRFFFGIILVVMTVTVL